MRGMLLAALLALTPGIGQAAQIYKWVDAQGVTHFDAQPPTGQPTQEINIQQQPSAPATSAPPATVDSRAEQRAIDNQVKRKVADEQARRSENCTVLRTNLAQLRNNPRVREQVEGGVRRLTEEQRQERIVETEKTISEYCDQ